MFFKRDEVNRWNSRFNPSKIIRVQFVSSENGLWRIYLLIFSFLPFVSLCVQVHNIYKVSEMKDCVLPKGPSFSLIFFSSQRMEQEKPEQSLCRCASCSLFSFFYFFFFMQHTDFEVFTSLFLLFFIFFISLAALDGLYRCVFLTSKEDLIL